MALGVPPCFVMGASVSGGGSGGGSSRKGSKGSTGGTGSIGGANSILRRNAAQTQAAGGGGDSGPGSSTGQMRSTVRMIQRALDAFVDESYGALSRLKQVAALSNQMQEIDLQDEAARKYMERQLELMGETLARSLKEEKELQKEGREELHRSVAVATRAYELWKTDFVRQHLAQIKGFVPKGTGPARPTSKTLGILRTYGLEGIPRPSPDVVLPPDDDGDPMKPASKGKKKKKLLMNDDANLLADDVIVRRERILKQTDGLFSGMKSILPGTSGPGSKGQRVPIPEIPSMTDAIARAEVIVTEKELRDLNRSETVDKMSQRQGIHTSTAKIHWFGLPVPDWNRLENMVAENMMDPLFLQEFVLLDMGIPQARIQDMRQHMIKKQKEQSDVEREMIELERMKVKATLMHKTAAAAASKTKAKGSSGAAAKRKKPSPSKESSSSSSSSKTKSRKRAKVVL